MFGKILATLNTLGGGLNTKHIGIPKVLKFGYPIVWFWNGWFVEFFSEKLYWLRGGGEGERSGG